MGGSLTPTGRMVRQVFERIESSTEEYLSQLVRLCRQPSISATQIGLPEMTELCAEIMEAYGLQTTRFSFHGAPPILLGERRGRSDRTLLFYGHYDVQPPDPVELWNSPPFEPTLREGRLFARGVADNKSPFMARLAAVKALLDVDGELPVSVKFLLEGEEEIGSPHLAPFLDAHLDRLRADGCIWGSECAVSMDGLAQISLGVKGLVYVELEACGPIRDLHSGAATSVVNPAWQLVWALDSLKDQQEKILIEGFYNRVASPSEAELQAVRRLPETDDEKKANWGVDRFVLGLAGFDLLVRDTFHPTCNISGIVSGYGGEGGKTILPSRAKANIDFRLVPDMDPADVLARLRHHLDANGFGNIRIREVIPGYKAWRTPIDDPFVRKVVQAATQAYGKRPSISPSMSASGSMHLLGERLGVPIATAGTTYPDSRFHAPNENIRVADFVSGTKHIAALLHELAE